VNLAIPDPHLEIVEVPITGLQRDLYESVRVVREEEVRKLLKEQGLKQATGQVLNAILGMRQIVCDPRTFTMQDHGIVQSAKLTRLTRLLEDFENAGTQALVFSSFERMMPLFQDRTNTMGMSSEIISGKVDKRHRPRIVDDFRSGKTQVLFATLGTMNSSIDLFHAKAMVLYEPWWNPQKENQGIGRMVRRGQEDQTTVYRLVSSDTVERQLVKIQDRKLALVDAVFEEDLDALSSSLTEEDVVELFR
jgi:SNF2 family DNA or RNA helicase